MNRLDVEAALLGAPIRQRIFMDDYKVGQAIHWFVQSRLPEIKVRQQRSHNPLGVWLWKEQRRDNLGRFLGLLP